MSPLCAPLSAPLLACWPACLGAEEGEEGFELDLGGGDGEGGEPAAEEFVAEELAPAEMAAEEAGEASEDQAAVAIASGDAQHAQQQQEPGGQEAQPEGAGEGLVAAEVGGISC